jgi:two-component system, LytTR family, sensor kinase
MLLLLVAVSVAQGELIRFVAQARGATVDAGLQLFMHATGAIAAWMALPIVLMAIELATGPRIRYLRLLAVHLTGYAAFSVVHFAGIRALRFCLSWGAIPDGPLWARFLWEAQVDLIVYPCIAGILTMIRLWEERHTAATRAAQLETQLAQARLAVLAAQLDPHFFFNALNTVSAVMYQDLAKTERLLSNLGQLVRTTLDSSELTWSLAEERRHVARYVELLEARFGDRLSVAWELAPELDPVVVPRFAIQTLVENAVKHNADRTAPLHIRIRAAGADREVRIVVEDDGRGFAQAVTGAGGLGRLEQTLGLLHGARGRVERGAGDPGGARVTLYLPREAA